MDAGPPPLRLRLRSQIVIPARSASSRLPRKLLLSETGRSVLEHTYRAAGQATRPLGICVAAADDLIAEDVRRFGGEVVMTDPDLPSGTDRVAAVARRRTDVEVFVNVQGDEPEIEAAQIDQVIALLEQHPQAAMSTLATPIRSQALLEDPACVKVVFDRQGQAMYFSRSVIPYARHWQADLLQAEPPLYFQHIGLYAYRRDFLLQFSQLPTSAIENTEKLEQLRVLEAGLSIQVAVTPQAARGIDTLEDYRAFVSRAQAC